MFVKGHDDKVYLFKKAIYDLKQAPRAWYSQIDDHLQDLGFKKSLSESTLFIERRDSTIMVISLYADDLLVIGNNLEMKDEFKVEMKKVFEMTD